MECGEKDGYRPGTVFALSTEDETGYRRFADQSGDWIRESWVNGEYINPLGLRQDVHEIFTEHNLEYQWENFGQLVVFESEKESIPSRSSEVIQHNQDNSTNPPMSTAAHSAMKELARIGAPVWDFYSYTHVYPPSTLRSGVQFVMTREPKLDILFADGLEAVLPEFSETKGLHPDVYAIVTKYGLIHHNHLHVYDDPIFRPKELIVFIDPKALATERGALKSS